MMKLDLDTVLRLEQEFGTPFYIFDKTSFVENYKEYESYLSHAYPNYRVAYSYKTNYTPYICSLVKRLGGYAEVVSGFEYSLAKHLGYNDNKIIFNGPSKGREGLIAFLNGCIFNLDNLDELNDLCVIVEQSREKSFEIGLRANLDIGQDFVSRFGMDEAGIQTACSIIEKIPNLTIVGLHCHISRCRGLNYWKKRTESMLNLADIVFGAKPPRYIDLGSGMYGKMDPEFAKQFDAVPSYRDYANVTAELFARHYKSVDDHLKPILFTEPGTTLVNKYVDFIAKVETVKTIRGKVFVGMNCSIHNLGETAALKQLPMRVISRSDNSQEYSKADLVGYTCLEQDVIYKGFEGRLGKGDYIQFGNVGGYSNVLKPPFIRPNCCILSKDSEGEFSMIKNSESYEDLIHNYMI